MATLAVLYKVGADISGLRDQVSKGVQVMEGLEKSGANVTSTLGTLGKAVAAAFTATAVADMGRQALDTASKVQDAADKMGIAAESVQRLQFAAEQGGASLDSVSRALAFMAKSLDEKNTPGKLAELGLNIDAIRAMSPDQAFIAIADAIGKLEDPIQQANLAQELLGRGAMELMPAMKAGFTEIGEMAPVMSNAMVKSADDTGDAIALMHKRIDVLKAQAMLPLLNLFTELPGPVQTFIGALATLAPSLSGLASLVMMAGGPVAAFTAISTLFTVTLPAAFAAVLPFLGPIGIIAVAVGAVVLAWKHWDTIVGFVKGVYTAVKDFIIDKVIPVMAAAGPLLGPVGMVVTVWKNWDKITAISKAVYEGVKEWLVDKFMAVVQKIKGAVDSVTGFFADMYDKVVGNSYVPDMISGVAREFGKLQAVMVAPALAGVDKVIKKFGEIDGVVKNVDKALGALKGGFDNVTSGGGLKSILGGFLSITSGIGGIVSAASLAINAISSLFNAFKSEESKFVNPARDEFIAMFGPGGTGEGSGFRTLANKLHELTGSGSLFDALASSRTMVDFQAAVSAIESVLKGWRPGQESGGGDDEEPESFATGSGGIRDFGAGTLAMLHGREGVFTEAQIAGMVGTPIIINNVTTLDGAVVARNQIKHLSRIWRDRQPVGAM